MGARGMSMSCLAVAVAVVMAFLGTASAATYNVGEPGGAWDLRTNYGNWVSSKKFHPGDKIVFKYSPQSHDVLEVSKADYDSCSNSNATNTLITGNDVVTLGSPGIRYFICGFPNHCTTTGTGLMKVQINVVPASGSSSPNPNPNPTPAPAGAPPSKPSSAATSPGGTAGFVLVALLAGRLIA